MEGGLEVEAFELPQSLGQEAMAGAIEEGMEEATEEGMEAVLGSLSYCQSLVLAEEDYLGS